MLYRSLLLAAAAVGVISTAHAGPILTDTLGSGTASVSSDAPGLVMSGDGSTGGDYAPGNYTLATDPQSAGGVQAFLWQDAAAVQGSSFTVDFLSADGSSVEALLSYQTFTNGYDLVSLTDYADDPGTALPGLTAGALDVAYGQDFNNPAFDLTVNMDEPPAPVPDPTAVPEPASIAVMGVGLLGTVGLVRRRRRAAAAACA